MLHRLCGPPSIPLSFNLATVLPRWITYRFRLDTNCISLASSNHRLRRGLPGYLILFAPHAFVPQRQYSLVSCLRNRCSISYLCISPLHDIFRPLHLYSRKTVSMAVLQLSCRLSPLTYSPAYGPFKPNKSG